MTRAGSMSRMSSAREFAWVLGALLLAGPGLGSRAALAREDGAGAPAPSEAAHDPDPGAAPRSEAVIVECLSKHTAGLQNILNETHSAIMSGSKGVDDALSEAQTRAKNEVLNQ